MVGTSLAQGLALLWLWRTSSDGDWPSQTPALNFSLWALAIVWPGLLLLLADRSNLARTLPVASAFAAVVTLLAAYLGWQASPYGAFPLFSLLGYSVGSLLLACFMALLYLQPWVAREGIGYRTLFALSWRNFLVATLAALATAIFYALLVLWGLLLAAIDITFFEWLFSEDWFLFPVLAVAFGLGIQVFRRLVHLIDGIAGLLRGLLWLLLPFAVGAQTVFLAALPFTGLAPLWQTGAGALLLLCLNGLVLFAANAVYQTGIGALPYPKAVHRALYAGLAMLPVITALAAYSLYLRIDQYGWSVQRCWGATVCAFFGLLSLGYAYAIVRRRDAWPGGLERVNTVAGWLVLAVMLLVNSPLLDFRSISLASQWQRVERGELAVRHFDFRYANEDLARPGWLKMQALIDEYEVEDPALAETIRTAKAGPPKLDQTRVWARARHRPATLEVPQGARDAALGFLDDSAIPVPAFYSIQGATEASWVGADLNADGKQDYILVWAGRRLAAGVMVYDDGSGAWRTALLTVREPLPPKADAAAALRTGEVSAVERTVRDLKIGDLVLVLDELDKEDSGLRISGSGAISLLNEPR